MARIAVSSAVKRGDSAPEAMRQAQREGESAALFPSRSSPRLSGKAINDVVKRAADRSGVRPYA